VFAIGGGGPGGTPEDAILRVDALKPTVKVSVLSAMQAAVPVANELCVREKETTQDSARIAVKAARS
jgi:hypothetical protein